jgi:hypothetical protein
MKLLTTIKVLYYNYSVCREWGEIILIIMKRVNFLTDEENNEIEEMKKDLIIYSIK